MSISDQAALQRITASRALDGDAARLALVYRGWSRSCDLDIGRKEYFGATIVAELASAVQTAYLAEPCSHGNCRHWVRNRPRWWAAEAPRVSGA